MTFSIEIKLELGKKASTIAKISLLARQHYNMIKTWSKHDQNMINTWSTHDQNMIKTWSKHDQNMIKTWLKHDQNMIKTWSKHDQNMIKTWSKHDQNMIKTWYVPRNCCPGHVRKKWTCFEAWQMFSRDRPWRRCAQWCRAWNACHGARSH